MSPGVVLRTPFWRVFVYGITAAANVCDRAGWRSGSALPLSAWSFRGAACWVALPTWHTDHQCFGGVRYWIARGARRSQAYQSAAAAYPGHRLSRRLYNLYHHELGGC